LLISKKVFPNFRNEVIFSLSADAREFGILKSSEDLKISITPGLPLRLFVAKEQEKGLRNLSRKYLSDWLKKLKLAEIQANFISVQNTIIDLVNEGYKPKDIRKNFHIVVLRAGDHVGVVSAFNQVCKPKIHVPKKRETKKRKHEAERELKTGRRGERKLERERRKKAKIAEEGRGVFVGQTVSLAEDFMNLSAEAYAVDASEKLLGNKYKKLYLDANNMMFMSRAFRECRGPRVEKLLSIAAFAFSQLVGVDTEIIFDNSRLPSALNKPDQPPVVQTNVAIGKNTTLQELNAEIMKFTSSFPLVGVTVVPPSGTSFEISSARATFKSTDDKLISYFRKPDQQPIAAAPNITSTSTTTVTAIVAQTPAVALLDPQQAIVVTSDRALAGELYSMGVTAFRPSRWIALLASLLRKISLQATESDVAMEPKEAEKKDLAESAQKIFEDWCFQFIARDEVPAKGKCRDKETAQTNSETVDETSDCMDLSGLQKLQLDG